MSQAEIDRFVAAVKTTPALVESYRTAADPADLAVRLRADGYDVTDAEVEEGIRQATETSSQELSDEQLDGVAGGFFSADFTQALQDALSRRR